MKTKPGAGLGASRSRLLRVHTAGTRERKTRRDNNRQREGGRESDPVSRGLDEGGGGLDARMKVNGKQDLQDNPKNIEAISRRGEEEGEDV